MELGPAMRAARLISRPRTIIPQWAAQGPSKASLPPAYYACRRHLSTTRPFLQAGQAAEATQEEHTIQRHVVAPPQDDAAHRRPPPGDEAASSPSKRRASRTRAFSEFILDKAAADKASSWPASTTSPIPGAATFKPAAPDDSLGVFRELGIKEVVLNAKVAGDDFINGYFGARPAPENVKLRLRPQVGRQVEVKGRVDFARSLRLLNSMCQRNAIKREARMQRFHERPGLRRKRLRSMRWTRKFKRGFKAVCNRVSRLAKQGW